MRGGQFTPAQQTKKTTRHYINTLITRGKIQRESCAYCGKSPTEFNHWSYEPRSMNGEFVCPLHHRIAHDIEKKLLTLFDAMC